MKVKLVLIACVIGASVFAAGGVMAHSGNDKVSSAQVSDGELLVQQNTDYSHGCENKDRDPKLNWFKAMFAFDSCNEEVNVYVNGEQKEFSDGRLVMDVPEDSSSVDVMVVYRDKDLLKPDDVVVQTHSFSQVSNVEGQSDEKWVHSSNQYIIQGQGS